MTNKAQRAASKRWLIKIRKSPKRYAVYLAARRKAAKRWRRNGGLKMQRKSQNASNLRLKIRVLSYYGKNGTLKCCWRNCQTIDIDLLTLDHINDNGHIHRKEGYEAGVNGLRQLKQQNFPEGFQTLCANHQLKKELIRRRKNRK